MKQKLKLITYIQILSVIFVSIKVQKTVLLPVSIIINPKVKNLQSAGLFVIAPIVLLVFQMIYADNADEIRYFS